MHWVARVEILVSPVSGLMVTPEERGLVRHGKHPRTCVHMKVKDVDVGRVWDCMLCTCVSEEGWDVEGAGSEAPSLLSYTLSRLL
jgi:hypothetical protein